jgi:hypothetical protein
MNNSVDNDQTSSKEERKVKISCLSCKQFDFEIDVSTMEIESAPVIALTCPQCGKSTSIQERPGGGIEIALDKHLEKTRR